ncbi:MAG: hypothetical protein ACYDCN_08775 [Bacteroidia bacterium]
MKHFLSFILAATLLTSCTYYKPCSFQVTNTYPNNTVLIGNVTASAKMFYFLGIGKIRKRWIPITQQAKDNLITKYKLKPNQTLTNISLDNIRTYWWIFGYTDRAIINADVVQFLKPGETYIPNDSLFMLGTKEVNGKKTNTYSSRFNYKLGEKVIITDVTPNLEAKIIELYDDETLVEYSEYSSDSEMSHFIKRIILYNKIQKQK